MVTKVSIATEDSSSLQISISGSRLEVLGFSHGRRVSISEEFGRITISLVSDLEVLPIPLASPVVVEEVEPEVTYDPEILFQKLSSLRREISAEQKVPPYIIFHDKTLREICRVLPVDLEAFSSIQGVGATKIEKYGSRFLEVVRAYIGE